MAIEEIKIDEGTYGVDLTLAKVTVLPCGYRNREGRVVPQSKNGKEKTIAEVVEMIRNHEVAGKVTETLRQIADKQEAREYKVMAFKTVLFGGVFSYRSAKGLENESGMMVLDFDWCDIQKAFPDCDEHTAVEKLKDMLIHDNNLDVVLCFISPSGNGVKVVIYVGDRQGLTFRETFDAVTCYISQRYKVKADKSGSDICRACFLAYDPQCYVNPDLDKMYAPRLDLKMWYEESKPKVTYVPKYSKSTSTRKNIYEFVENMVRTQTFYVPGQFNRYVMKCGYLLCNFGVDEKQATDWAVSRFNDYDSREVRAIFASVYRNGEFGKYRK